MLNTRKLRHQIRKFRGVFVFASVLHSEEFDAAFVCFRDAAKSIKNHPVICLFFLSTSSVSRDAFCLIVWLIFFAFYCLLVLNLVPRTTFHRSGDEADLTEGIVGSLKAQRVRCSRPNGGKSRCVDNVHLNPCCPMSFRDLTSSF